MSTTENPGGGANPSLDARLEVIVIPVSDVDRAKEFYGRLGWRLDADRAGDGFRLVQFTPPGSGCSVQFGTNLTPAQPGSAQATLLTVADIDAAHADLAMRGIDVSEVYHCATGTACRFLDGDGAFERVSGPAADHASYYSFASFSDPDGTRRPGDRLGLAGLGDQPLLVVGEVGVDDDDGPADVGGPGGGVQGSGPQRAVEAGAGVDGGRARALGEVEECAHRANGVGERHDRTAVQHAADGAAFRRPAEAAGRQRRRDLVQFDPQRDGEGHHREQFAGA